MTRLLHRACRMDAAELRFRASSELRKWQGRARLAIRGAEWRNDTLKPVLAPARPGDPAALKQARQAAARSDWPAVHRELAAHFASRGLAFPHDSRTVRDLAQQVAIRFPSAPADARDRAERILDGCYDILGFTDVRFGHPPDWHADPVHAKRAPRTYWAAVPYLDPECGDHKIIWELNRHQHWLTLGRAFALTHDPRFYREFVFQLENWMAENPPLLGINWASMLELGFRSLSWLWALAFFAPAALAFPDGNDDWIVKLLVGIDRQLTHIEHNLSRYFSPNTHLTGEALALYVAGLSLPELAASARRVKTGRDILDGEADRQIAADGGHAELSAHYHRYSTDFYLLALAVARRADDEAAPRFADAARRQAGYLRALADDRGRLPLIGDDDGGTLFPVCRRSPNDCADSLAIAATLLKDPALRVGPPPEEAFWLCGMEADRPAGRTLRSWPSQALTASGYYVSRNRYGDHLVFDGGRHGYLNCGHAHADALSVTLTVRNTPLLIDPGTATYTMAPDVRDRFRSTRMHNTVVINDAPQSRPNGAFHWDSIANARAAMWRSWDRGDYVEGTHSAYAPLTHTRTLLALHGVGWLILDHVLGSGAAKADAQWHLAPHWKSVGHTERTAQLVAGSLRTAVASTSLLRVVDGCDDDGLGIYSPAYGVVRESITLQASVSGEPPLTLATFIAANAEVASDLSIRCLAVVRPPDARWHHAALVVAWRTGSLTAMAAIEPAGGPDGDDAAPAAVWGTTTLETDGRVGALLTLRGGVSEALIVNGSMLRQAGGTPIVKLSEALPIAFGPVPSAVASSVHWSESRDTKGATLTPELEVERGAGG